MRTKRHKPLVLVTGSAGLIGKPLVAELARDHRVVGLDVRPPSHIPAGSDFIHCDLTSDTSVRRALAEICRRHEPHLASVIHLASHCGIEGKPSPLYDQLTVQGTRRLIRSLHDFWVEQLVYTSTSLMMKPATPGDVITETSPLAADWLYTRSKLEAEHVIDEERGRIPVVILRTAMLYDELGHNPLVALQLRRVYEHMLPPQPPPSAALGQTSVHVADLVSAVRKTIEHRRALGDHEVFLIAEPEVPTYGELIDSLGALIHGTAWSSTPPAKLQPSPAQNSAPPAQTAPASALPAWTTALTDAASGVSIDRARARLGWEPEHRLAATLDEMVANLKRDPRTFFRENGLCTDDAWQSA